MCVASLAVPKLAAGSTPEMGVTGYVNDRTQGPCCAIACGAGTVYRNYLAPVRDSAGRLLKSEAPGRSPWSATVSSACAGPRAEASLLYRAIRLATLWRLR